MSSMHFLNRPLEEDVYVLQPPGFEKSGREQQVYILKKALYGVNHVAQIWNKVIDAFLHKQGVVKSVVIFGVRVWKKLNIKFCSLNAFM